MSSGTSGSFQSAELGKKYFHEMEAYRDVPVYVVDSKSMSHGSGWLIIIIGFTSNINYANNLKGKIEKDTDFKAK